MWSLILFLGVGNIPEETWSIVFNWQRKSERVMMEATPSGKKRGAAVVALSCTGEIFPHHDCVSVIIFCDQNKSSNRTNHPSPVPACKSSHASAWGLGFQSIVFCTLTSQDSLYLQIINIYIFYLFSIACIFYLYMLKRVAR